MIVLVIIGRVLLTILIVILLLILYFLLFPFHYRVSFSKCEEFKLSADVYTFLHFLHGRYEKDAKDSVTLKIFWNLIQLLPKKSKPIKQTKNVEASDDSPQENEVKEPTEAYDENVETFEEDAWEEEPFDEEKVKDDDLKEKKKFINSSESEDDRFQKIKDISFEIKDKTNQSAVKKILKNVFYILKKIKPRVKSADVDFSLGEPDTTGYICAFLAAVPFTYEKNVRVAPDFESEDLFFKGEATLAGNVCLIYILIAAIRILLDESCRNLFKKLGGDK